MDPKFMDVLLLQNIGVILAEIISFKQKIFTKKNVCWMVFFMNKIFIRGNIFKFDIFFHNITKSKENSF